MRASSVLVLSLPLLACGGAVEPVAAPVVTVPVASAAPPPPPPALPAEPEGLVTPSGPAKVCELSGTIGQTPLDLAVADGAAYGQAQDGSVTMVFGEHDAFAEVRAPSWTVRGIPTAEGSRVHAARWISFGGVLFAGASDRLEVKVGHDGKLVLAAPDAPGFTLAEEGRLAEVPCDALSLDPDASNVLRQDPPAQFLPDKQEQRMLLRRKKPVAVSVDVRGPAAGTFDASGTPANVTMLERRGGRARIRWGHVAGWVDAALLSKAKPLSPRQQALREAAQFGMIGLLSTGGAEARRVATAPAASPVVCTADVRLVVDAGKAARPIIGAIPAGQPVRVTDRGPELSTVTLDGPSFAGGEGGRLAVPSRDIAVGCTPAPEGMADDKARSVTARDLDFPDDAIDNLDGDPPIRSWGHFGSGGLGSGGGVVGGFGGLGTGGHAPARSGGPSLREGSVQVNGRLPPEVVQRIVRQNFGRFRLCYEQGLQSNPALTGRVTVKFQIDASGAVTNVADGGSDLPSTGTVACVVRGFTNLSFPQPEGGIVSVTYPVHFSPAKPDAAKH
jgi:hypothetical protein